MPICVVRRSDMAVQIVEVRLKIGELDDAYMGGDRTGCKRGRGAEGKTPFVAAVETTQNNAPVKVKLTVVPGFRKTAIELWGETTFNRRNYSY
ncbi:MAG: hypothetical protein ACI9Y1_001757 [Lentisphaeria bacterium]|jgi:hypothetical protein